MFSARADIVARRTYSRLKDDGHYETWTEVVDRVTSHQLWLWERAQGKPLSQEQINELRELRLLMLERKALVAGRTLWLGGTDLVKRREIANFNCSYLNISTIHDFVDAFWLLLNGCGVGFRPIPGTINGFMRPIPEIEIVRSKRKTKGRPSNREEFDSSTGVWTLDVGDSGEAWAKSIGKLLAGKYAATKLVLDFSEIRPAGTRLAGYGWICSGDTVIAEEYPKIVAILNRRAGRLLTHIDILDIMNHLGVVQTGRRGAEIALFEYGKEGWYEFAAAKKNFWETGNPQRSQSNNSLLFWTHPSRSTIASVLDLMVQSGGSEPGIVNGEAASARAPWFSGTNPCAEILLPDRGNCNLVTTNIAAFQNQHSLHRAMYLITRANYRQTLVNLDDGILQRSWHENNQFLRLCGSSLAGQVLRSDLLNHHDLSVLRRVATLGAYSMADELGSERPKNITAGKPDGTLAKIMDTTEGIHRPSGKYIFNNITFSKHDNIVKVLDNAGYHVFDNPLQPDGVVVRFPISWEGAAFDGGFNKESAVSQLERYKLLMGAFIDQNQSITVSYSPDEIPLITDWLDRNWDQYVGVSFLPRNDPTKTAKDLGYPYLPQEVVDRTTFEEYNARLKTISDGDIHGSDELIDIEDCEGGVCPVR